MEGFQLKHVEFILKTEQANTSWTEFQLELNEIMVAFYDGPISHRITGKYWDCAR